MISLGLVFLSSASALCHYRDLLDLRSFFALLPVDFPKTSSFSTASLSLSRWPLQENKHGRTAAQTAAHHLTNVRTFATTTAGIIHSQYLGLLAWCLPCITYGRTHHRLHKDSSLQGWSMFNMDVSITAIPLPLLRC